MLYVAHIDLNVIKVKDCCQFYYEINICVYEKL